jgi:nitrogen-specific signal transduction histidine kinase
MKSFVPREKNISHDAKDLTPFLMELVHRIKNPLVSVKTFTQLLQEKFNDEEFRDQFYKVVCEDIEKIDSLLNGLLNYIKIDMPIEKRNTVHLVLEKALEKHELQIRDRQIRIFRKYERSLPETIIHEEQLRYVLSSVLQYVISFTLPKGSIGFLTKSLNTQKENDANPILRKEIGGYIEILIVFTGYIEPSDALKGLIRVPGSQHEEEIELELQLIKGIMQKNQGEIIFEVDEKKLKTLISLKFPIERRKVIYYPSIDS